MRAQEFFQWLEETAPVATKRIIERNVPVKMMVDDRIFQTARMMAAHEHENRIDQVLEGRNILRELVAELAGVR